MNPTIEIDGSQGEGGGQVLRSSLALAIITGKPVHLYNIRARRDKPGLAPQHLKALDAAAAVCAAEVQGAQLRSQAVTFQPGSLRSGRYRFDIGTAGASGLVLQTILAPLSLSSAASSVSITGGTHVPHAPVSHYLQLQWLPALRQAGFEADMTMEAAGFYPRGGGRIDAVIRPASEIHGLDLSRRGKLRRIYGVSAVINLPEHIAARQKRQAIQRLQTLATPGGADWAGAPNVQVKSVSYPSPGPGTFVVLLAEFEHGRACYTGLGELGKPAERVADEAVDALLAFLDGQAAIDRYLADQLLLPLCLAQSPSHLSTEQVTQHLLTNAGIIQRFVDCRIEIHGQLGQPGDVRIVPAPKSP